MNAQEFYDYIRENYNLADETYRLIRNIIDYVEMQGFVDAKDGQSHMRCLLDGIVERNDANLYLAAECRLCCSGYVTNEDLRTDDDLICEECRGKGSDNNGS